MYNNTNSSLLLLSILIMSEISPPNNNNDIIVDRIEIQPSESLQSPSNANAGDNADNNTIEGYSKTDNVFSEVVDDRGGIIYDIMHAMDDIYVYGRTIIENNYFNFSSNEDFNLVYPNIYIGNYSTSTNRQLLEGLGITHIISVIPTFNPPFAQDCNPNDTTTNDTTTNDTKNFTYLHVPAYDDESQDMRGFFSKTNTFIANILSENKNNKILIHCMVGRSRSITILMAFLIHIIKNQFDQSLINLELTSDVANEIDYKNFGKCNNHINIDGVSNTNNMNRQTSSRQMNQIYQNDFEKPVLTDKYKNFINYKKECMIEEIHNLAKEYQSILSSNSIIDNKTKTDYYNKLLGYVRKYRRMATPNSYFQDQLINELFDKN